MAACLSRSYLSHSSALTASATRYRLPHDQASLINLCDERTRVDVKLEGRMNRRSLLGSTVLAVAALLKWPRSIGVALADDKNWRHGVSSFGDLKYSAGFRHFDYVNADAPKGGTAREAASGTFVTSTGRSPALRARSPSVLILSTRRFWCRRLTKYRPDMGCLPKQ